MFTFAFRLSTVSLAGMLEAVVFLKDLQKNGSVLEVAKGIWLRCPIYKNDPAHGEYRNDPAHAEYRNDPAHGEYKNDEL